MIQSFEILTSLNWYNVSEFVSEIYALRRVDFSIVERRKQALERLNNLNGSAPFARNRRFPSDALYIAEGISDWSRQLQQLKTSLSLKEKENKPVEKIVTLGPSNYSDSQMAFWNATTSALDSVVRKDGVFDRTKFEQTFQLAWKGGRYIDKRVTSSHEEEVEYTSEKPPKVEHREIVGTEEFGGTAELQLSPAKTQSRRSIRALVNEVIDDKLEQLLSHLKEENTNATLQLVATMQKEISNLQQEIKNLSSSASKAEED